MNIWQWHVLPPHERPPLQQVGGNAYFPFFEWTIGALWGCCKSDFADVASYKVWFDGEIAAQNKRKAAQLSHFGNHDANVNTPFYNQPWQPPATIKPWPE